MQHGYQRALNIIGLVVAAGLNVAVVSFYVLWFIADSDAINRMETATSVDPTVLLPNATLLWLAANASLVALLALDGVIVAMTMAARSRCWELRWRGARPQRTPPFLRAAWAFLSFAAWARAC